jgi:hypothetical protein
MDEPCPCLCADMTSIHLHFPSLLVVLAWLCQAEWKTGGALSLFFQRPEYLRSKINSLKKDVTPRGCAARCCLVLAVWEETEPVPIWGSYLGICLGHCVELCLFWCPVSTFCTLTFFSINAFLNNVATAIKDITHWPLWLEVSRCEQEMVWR